MVWAESLSLQEKYGDAEQRYADVVGQFGDSHFAPQAVSWRAVVRDQPDTSAGLRLARPNRARLLSIQFALKLAFQHLFVRILRNNIRIMRKRIKALDSVNGVVLPAIRMSYWPSIKYVEE